ncbi:MAG: hypothetical protein ACYDH1_10200 [Anaerolineaceae bacterium]
MSDKFKKFIYLIWPPYQALMIDDFLEKKENKNFKQQEKELGEKIYNLKHDEIVAIEYQAKLVFDLENKRKETLETKAVEYLSGFGLILSVFSAIPLLNSEHLVNYLSIKIFLVIIYLLGIIHLATAVNYSSKVRHVLGLATFTVDELIANIFNEKDIQLQRIISYLFIPKFNEPYLIKKANYLSVAEEMFKRGLFFITLMIIFGGFAIIFVSNSNSTTACVIPNLIGFKESSAEIAVSKLGLTPLFINSYDVNSTLGNVIYQNPPENSVMIPCKGEINMVISIGQIQTIIPSPTIKIIPSNTKAPPILKPYP